MQRRPRLRQVLRAGVLGSAALLLVGADGCEVIGYLIENLTGLAYGVRRAAAPPPVDPPDLSLEMQVATLHDELPETWEPVGRFGASVAVEGGVLVVGAPTTIFMDAFLAENVGAAFVHSRSAGVWRQTALLAPQHATSQGWKFGSAVAVSGAKIYVGAPGETLDGRTVGGVHEYAQVDDAWQQSQLLRSSGFAPDSEFGAALDVDGDYLVVGAPNASGDGRAYVFERQNGRWTQAAVLAGTVDAYGERFGHSVAIDGTTVVVGAPGSPGGTDYAGSAHVFERGAGGWQKTAVLVHPEPTPGDLLGWDVAVDGDDVAVGAPGDETGLELNSGSVWLFRRPFEEAEPLTASQRVADGQYGWTVDADQGVLAVGFPAKGRVDVHSRGTQGWRLDRVLSYHDPNSGIPHDLDRNERDSDSPRAVAIDGRTVVAGSPDHLITAVDVYEMSAAESPGKTARAGPPLQSYLAFRSKAKARGPASATLPLGRTLRPPLRVEISAGSYDPAKRAGLTGGAVTIEFEQRDVTPKRTAALVARFVADGLEISATTDAGAAGTKVALPGTWIADLAADCDGTTLRLEARRRGAGTFTVIASIPAAGVTFRPTVRIDGIGPGAEVGLDEPRVVANAPAPPGATALETVRDRIYAAMDRQNDALAQLDLGGGDATAGPLLDAASVKLSEALTDLSAMLTASKRAKTGPAPARRFVSNASRALAKARAKLKKGKSASVVTKALSTVFAAEGRAIRALAD